MADLTQQPSSQAGMTDLINATKGQALNTGALVQSSQNLVTSNNNLVSATNTQATNTGTVATQTANLVTQTTNLVTQTTNQVTATNNLTTAVTNLTTSINNALSQGPWSTWSPTIGSGSGALTTIGTVTARYSAMGKTIFFYLIIPITTNGTAASFITATLPVTLKNNTSFYGREDTNGKQLQAKCAGGSTNMSIFNYDNTYPGSSGASILISGIYEAQ